jgi:hypothetical protein
MIINRRDWTLESQAPASSYLLTDKSFGSYGGSPGFCVNTGPFAGLQTTLSHGGCLQRDTTNLAAFFGYYSEEAVAMIMVSYYLFSETRLRLIVVELGLNQVRMEQSMLDWVEQC